MKFRDKHPLGSEITGRASSPPADLGRADLESWRRRLGYFSLFAGVATITAAQATQVSAIDRKVGVPPRNAKTSAEFVKSLNSGACSKPALLQRQSEYRLPNQQAEFNMLELLAGADNCPGTPIPPGTYTAAAPFTDSGNTTGANFTVDFVNVTCNGNYTQVAGPDHIYSFKIESLGPNPQIIVSTASGTYDLAIYILNGEVGPGCPADNPGTPTNPLTNCLVGSDNVIGPGNEVIGTSQMQQLPLNTQLHLFIDSFYDVPGLGNGPYTVTMRDVTVASPFNPPENDAPVDINGDGKTDYVTVRNVGGGPSGQVRWYTSFADGFPTSPTDWGIASDQFIPADFDGDGKDDFAVFRPSSGTFYIVRSGSSTMYVEQFGQNGDDASVVGDYDGDNVDDLAVYRSGATPADQSRWYYRSIGSPPGFHTIPWGQGGDFPAPGDYDGDGKNDFVVQRADSNGVNGRFWVRLATGTQYSLWFGLKDDVIVPGDYDGDGKTDIAVARDDNGQIRWEFEPSGTDGHSVVSDTWGVSATDWIAQGDYDGDGKTDYAIYRPGSPGTFYVMTSIDRLIWTRIWGEANDFPVANYNEH